MSSRRGGTLSVSYWRQLSDATTLTDIGEFGAEHRADANSAEHRADQSAPFLIRLEKGPVGKYAKWGVYIIGVSLLFSFFFDCGMLLERMFFRTESALWFRFANVVSQTGYLPSLDTALQHPEGMRIYQDTPVLMHYFVGYLFALARGIGITDDLQVFIAGVRALLVPLNGLIAFGVARHFVGNRLGAAMGALVYVTSRSFYGRSYYLDAYLLEQFALPFFFLGCYLWLRALDHWSWQRSLAAGGAFAVALGSWHFPQFLMLFLVGFLALQWMSRRDLPEQFLPFVAATLALPVLVGFIAPFIEAFYLSLLFLTSLALVAAIAIASKYELDRAQRVGGFVGLAAALVFASNFFETGDYSHDFELLWAKIVHLWQKPQDPGVLSFDARVLWAAGFVTPTWPQLRLDLGAAILLASIPFMSRVGKFRTLRPSQQFLLWMAIVFACLYPFFVRVGPLLVFFLAPLIASYRLRRTFVVALCIGVAVNSFWLVRMTTFPDCRWPPEEGIVEIVTDSTQPGDVILADFMTSPTIVAYLGRQTVLHSIFESEGLRRKVQRFYEALLEPEEEFYRFAKSSDADYYLYERHFFHNESDAGYRYNVNMRQGIPEGSSLWAFENTPTDMRYFELVERTPTVGLFRVRDEPFLFLTPRP
jgi:hypothetical protein